MKSRFPRIALVVLPLLFLMGAGSVSDETETWEAVLKGRPDLFEVLGTMKGHEDGAGKIIITRKGLGLYSLTGIDRIQETDLFPSSDPSSNSVGEIRIVCDPYLPESIRNVMNIEPLAFEAGGGKKTRIELRCMKANEMQRWLLMARAAIRGHLRKPQKAVRDAKPDLDTCAKTPSARECSQPSAALADIISNILMKPIDGAVNSCGVPFTAGLDLERRITPKKSEGDVLDGIDFEAPFDGNLIEIQLDLARLIPGCGRDFFQTDAGTGFRPGLIDRDKCFANLAAFRKALAKRGVERLDQHQVRFRGKEMRQMALFGEYKDRLATMFTMFEMQEDEVGSIVSAVKLQDIAGTSNPGRALYDDELHEVPPSWASAVGGSQDDWLAAAQVAGLDKVTNIYQKGSNHPRYSQSSNEMKCFADVACHERVELLRIGFEKAMRLAKFENGGCYKTVPVLPTPDKPGIGFALTPDQGGCKSRIQEPDEPEDDTNLESEDGAEE